MMPHHDTYRTEKRGHFLSFVPFMVLKSSKLTFVLFWPSLSDLASISGVGRLEAEANLDFIYDFLVINVSLKVSVIFVHKIK